MNHFSHPFITRTYFFFFFQVELETPRSIKEMDKEMISFICSRQPVLQGKDALFGSKSLAYECPRMLIGHVPNAVN